jgi:putative hydrolase of the HAD superfamily
MKLSEGLNISGSEIKNIIFDWGGVITNLHFDRSIEAFRRLGFHQFQESFFLQENHSFFIQFEMGMIAPAVFISELKKFLPADVTDDQILNAWNAMLGSLPAERWSLLEQLKGHYRTFLLSNTNSLHIDYYFSLLQDVYGTYGYTHLFEKVYFSHLLKMRKPNRNIYEHVLQDSRLEPAETLFIDDNPHNIETALQLGIRGYLLSPPHTLTDIFSHGQN